jgi:hypothetical protein
MISRFIYIGKQYYFVFVYLPDDGPQGPKHVVVY